MRRSHGALRTLWRSLGLSHEFVRRSCTDPHFTIWVQMQISFWIVDLSIMSAVKWFKHADIEQLCCIYRCRECDITVAVSHSRFLRIWEESNQTKRKWMEGFVSCFLGCLQFFLTWSWSCCLTPRTCSFSSSCEYGLLWEQFLMVW